MKPIAQVIAGLGRQGLKLRLEDGQLHFKGPPEALQSVEFAELKGRKAEAISFLAETRNTRTIPPLVAGDRPAVLPLSSAQRAWVELNQLWGPRQELTSKALRFRGPLDVTALERALVKLAARHEILRTRFERHEGTPVQKIDVAYRPKMTVLDLTSRASEDLEMLAAEIAAAERIRPFDLFSEDLSRPFLLKISDDDHIFFVVFDHSVMDLLSWRIFFREFIQFYGECALGRRSRQKRLPAQYADYALWENEWLGGSRQGQHLAYWEQKLSGVAPLELPTAKPREPGVQLQHSAEGLVDLPFPKDLFLALRDLGRVEGVTVQVMLLAVYSLILSKWSGQRELVFGFIVANRPRAVEGLLGAFVRCSPIHLVVDETVSLSSFLKSARQACLDAMDLRHTTTVKLKSETKIYRVMANFTKRAGTSDGPSTFKYAGLEINRFEGPSAAEKRVPYDLQLHTTESARGLAGRLSYAAGLFDEQRIEWFCESFNTLLGLATMRRHLKVGDVLEAINMPIVGLREPASQT